MKVLSEKQKFRCQIRNSVENIVKEKNINRNFFHEADKHDYKKIIRKAYYSFCDYEKYPNVTTEYMWLRFRKALKFSEPVREDLCNWKGFIDNLDILIPEKDNTQFLYLITDGDWVYEGKLYFIKQVLYEYPQYLEEFYIISRDYSWIVSYSDDSASLLFVH